MRDVLDCRVEDVPGGSVVHVRGEVDLLTAPEFERRLLEAAARGPRVVVDLSAVAHFDGSGLRALQTLLRRVESDPARLVVVAPPGSVSRRVIEVVRFDEVLSVADTRGAALRRIRDAG